MDERTPVLVGIDGIAAGEHFLLDRDRPVAVGRSSTCEVSLQNVPRYQALSEAQRAEQVGFQAVSRRHLTITVTGSQAHLENHSQAGTWCDEVRFDRTKTIDIDVEGVTLRLGPSEQFRLMLVDRDGLEQLLSRTRPMTLGTTRLRGPEDQIPTTKRPALGP